MSTNCVKYVKSTTNIDSLDTYVFSIVCHFKEFAVVFRLCLFPIYDYFLDILCAILNIILKTCN